MLSAETTQVTKTRISLKYEGKYEDWDSNPGPIG